MSNNGLRIEQFVDLVDESVHSMQKIILEFHHTQHQLYELTEHMSEQLIKIAKNYLEDSNNV